MNKSVLVTGVVLLALVVSCKNGVQGPSQTKEKEAVKVSVMSVEPVAGSDRHSYVGVVDPARKAVVSARHSGTLASVTVRKGDVVSKGQKIAEINSQTAKSAYDVAKASLEQARDGYERANKVYGTGGISEVQYMDIKTKLAQAEAAMSAASRALEECTVRAPFSGVVNDVYVNEGEEINVAGRIATIVDMKAIQIRIQIHEDEINKVSEGLYAYVDVPAFDKEGLRARVIGRSLVPAPLSHSYECNLKLDRIPEGLLPGMTVKVRFEQKGQEAIVVPATAVQLDPAGRYVWLSDNGTVRKSYVKVGGYSGKGVVVTEGLVPGDKVIVKGYQKVSTGMKVVAE
ncbi:MAG: efflux RND transporter periplasmic adaptor subunit [Bacteroidales bacterium]|nr:efflux RND transporter periplasmic adaptor subunit [Candidatus Cryptobacteroides fimicaballi]